MQCSSTRHWKKRGGGGDSGGVEQASIVAFDQSSSIMVS